MIRHWVKDQKGATAIEYAMIAALISVSIIVGLTSFTNGTGSMFGRIKNAFDTHMSG